MDDIQLHTKSQRDTAIDMATTFGLKKCGWMVEGEANGDLEEATREQTAARHPQRGGLKQKLLLRLLVLVSGVLRAGPPPEWPG